jgi:RNA polymerase sigma-70 factor (ECF subfamily)
MTGNRSASEDLVQDVFFRILKYRRTFRNSCRFRTWMYGIARNAHRDHCRNLPAVAPLSDENTSAPHGGSLPYREYELSQQAATLQCALLQLPADRRELIVLSQYQKLKSRQIAELLDIEPAAVRVRLHRAMNELRQVYLKLSSEKQLCSVKKPVVTLRTV